MVFIIGGKFKNRRLQVPKNHLRPTTSLVRESVFNILQNYIEDMTVLDLCAGSGAIGLEALSRGASHVTFVEKDREACNCIKTNLKALDLKAEVFCMEAAASLSYFAAKKMTFDLIYVDPPYEFSGLIWVKFIDRHHLLNPNGWLLYESGEKHEIELDNLEMVNSRKYGKSYINIYR